MGFWTQFFLFTPPVALVIAGIIFYVKTAGKSGGAGGGAQ